MSLPLLALELRFGNWAHESRYRRIHWGKYWIGFKVKGYEGMGEEDARAVKKGYRGMRGV